MTSRPIDLILDIIVSAAHDRAEPVAPGAGENITIGTRGLVVTGEMIPHWQWLEEFASDQGRSGFAPISEQIRDEVRARAAVVADPEGEWTTEQRALAEGSHQFVSLRDAFVVDPAGRTIPSGGRGMYWRVPVEAIDGWSIGRLNVSGITDLAEGDGGEATGGGDAGGPAGTSRAEAPAS